MAPDGSFNIALAPAQADGGNLQVTLSDAAGHTSEAASTPTQDHLAPDAPIDLVVNPAGSVLTGRGEAGTTVKVTTADGVLVGTALVGAGGTFTVPLSPQQADGRPLEVTLQDTAGNTSEPGTAATPVSETSRRASATSSPSGSTACVSHRT